MARSQFTILRCHLPGVLPVVAESARAFARHTHDQFGVGVIERGAQTSRSGRGQIQIVGGMHGKSQRIAQTGNGLQVLAGC